MSYIRRSAVHAVIDNNGLIYKVCFFFFSICYLLFLARQFFLRAYTNLV